MLLDRRTASAAVSNGIVSVPLPTPLLFAIFEDSNCLELSTSTENLQLSPPSLSLLFVFLQDAIVANFCLLIATTSFTVVEIGVGAEVGIGAEFGIGIGDDDTVLGLAVTSLLSLFLFFLLFILSLLSLFFLLLFLNDRTRLIVAPPQCRYDSA